MSPAAIVALVALVVCSGAHITAQGTTATYALLISGQSNAVPTGLDALAVTSRFAVCRRHEPGTAISQWQKGQALGNQLRAAVANGGFGLPLVVIWIQGEADSTVGLAPLYEGALRTFLSDLRADLGDPHIFVVGINAGFAAYPERATVRAAQETVCAENPSRWHIVNPDAITAEDDNHYTGAGYLQLNTLLANAVNAVLPP